MNNRGRIQAQGNRTEKSAPWAKNTDVTKCDGIERIEHLENQLSRPEIELRNRSLMKARNFVNTAPSIGISAQVKKTYYDDFTKREIRVDVEIIKGVAFRDDKNEE